MFQRQLLVILGVVVLQFHVLKQLHHLEVDLTIKYAYKLSAKALSPLNLERQNVKLVIQVFNEFARVESLTFHIGRILLRS